MADDVDHSSLTPDAPQRTTGGNFRWEPPSPAELEAQMPGYTIEKILGRGGMGAVYRGVQTNLDRTVAIKILPPGVEQEDPSFAERFRNEAKLMAKLNHPAVVAVHDFGTTTSGLLYFAMEYVDGTDVSQMIRSQKQLPPEHALAITAHVCDALAAAHELGIVHRDIKPANVLLNMKGQVKVADFGLAKVEEPGTHGLTKTGYAMGTPDFVAPEVLMLGANIDGRADLYAVGVMLYQMLTGEVPRGAFKPATARLPGLDPRFDPIIVKAMQSDREERYQSSAELRRDLDVILTVPFVRQDDPPSAAIPAAQVAQQPAQRSAAQRPDGRRVHQNAESAAAPDRTLASEPTPKSKVPLLLGLAAAAAVGVGAFVMFSAGEKAKQRGPLTPVSGTSVTTASNPAQGTERTTISEPVGASEPSKANPKSLITAKAPEPPKAAPGPQPTAAVVEAKPAAPTPKPASPPETVAPAMAASKPAPTPTPTAAPVSPPPASPSPSLPISKSSPSELDQRLAALDASFQAAVERDANTAFKASMADLDKLYLGALDRALATASKGGKLEEALALRAEKQRVAQGEAMPSEVDESTQAKPVPATLKTLRQTYRSTAAQHEATKLQAMQPLYDKYDQALVAVQTELTQGRKLDDALRVKNLRENLVAAQNGQIKTTELSRAVDAVQTATAASGLSSGGWLSAARKRGGPLKLWGGAELGQTIGVPARAARYDDYVSLNMFNWSAPVLFATRRDGIVVVLDFTNFPSIDVAELRIVATTNAGTIGSFLAKDGKVRRPDGLVVFDPRTVRKPAGFAQDSRGGIVYSAEGDFELFGSLVSSNEFKGPADDFIKGHHIQAAGATDGSVAFLTDEAKVLAWDYTAKKPVEFGQLQNSRVVEMACGSGFAFRTDDGRILLCDGRGRFGNGNFPARGTQVLKGQTGPFVRVQGTGGFGAAQREDGSWLGWGDAATLDDRVKSLGSVLDLDGAYKTEGNSKQVQSMTLAWIELPSGAKPASAAPKPATPTATPPVAQPPSPASAAKSDFTNSLGMKFVKVPGTQVLFCIHETRKGDYAKYAAKTPGVDKAWEKGGFGDPTFNPTDDHPVINVSWEDARAFASWLSAKEGRKYRLPTDNEWSFAVGIGRSEKKGQTPEALKDKGRDERDFPWGDQFPPPVGAGNYADTAYGEASPGASHLKSYTDGYAWTAPVMSFTPNKLGIYDLGGNVAEWCEDWFNEKNTDKVIRGGSWLEVLVTGFLSSARRHVRDGDTTPATRDSKIGFRIVLETTD